MTPTRILEFMRRGAPLVNRGRYWTLSNQPVPCASVAALESCGAIRIEMRDRYFAKAVLTE